MYNIFPPKTFFYIPGIRINLVTQKGMDFIKEKQPYLLARSFKVKNLKWFYIIWETNNGIHYDRILIILLLLLPILIPLWTIILLGKLAEIVQDRLFRILP